MGVVSVVVVVGTVVVWILLILLMPVHAAVDETAFTLIGVLLLSRFPMSAIDTVSWRL